MPIRFRSAALAAGAGLLALIAGPALADPALWRVQSGASTVYLFGTVHLLNPALPWRTAAIDKAFRESGELWLEVPFAATPAGSDQPITPEEQQRLAQLIATQGTTTEGPPLSSRLSPAETTELAAVVPIPQAQFDRMRPWLAATMVQASMLLKVAQSPNSGADIVLDQEAVTQGKPVKGFETAEQQVHFFADLSAEEEMGFLRQALADAQEGEALIEAMQRAWLAGDEETLTKLAIGRGVTYSPAFYRRFDVDRNRSWLPRIETMLKTPGVRFVAVGAGHMLGSDGLPALLEKDGLRVERVQ